jgi:hypothetical protein
LGIVAVLFFTSSTSADKKRSPSGYLSNFHDPGWTYWKTDKGAEDRSGGKSEPRESRKIRYSVPIHYRGSEEDSSSEEKIKIKPYFSKRVGYSYPPGVGSYVTVKEEVEQSESKEEPTYQPQPSYQHSVLRPSYRDDDDDDTLYGGGGGHGGHGGGGYGKKAQPYHFQYYVKDDYTYNDFGQTEKSDGKTVYGSYRVKLPDGRTQIVTYTADHENGYQANVKYEGTAHHPPPKYYQNHQSY